MNYAHSCSNALNEAQLSLDCLLGSLVFKWVQLNLICALSKHLNMATNVLFLKHIKSGTLSQYLSSPIIANMLLMVISEGVDQSIHCYSPTSEKDGMLYQIFLVILSFHLSETVYNKIIIVDKNIENTR